MLRERPAGGILTDRAIAQLRWLFIALLRCWPATAEIALVDPRLAADGRNPRRADVIAGRGTIFARDGSPLAIVRDGKRVYPLGSAAAHVVGYASVRYGTTGLEGAFDRLLAARPHTDAFAEVRSLIMGGRAASTGVDLVTTLSPQIQRTLAQALAARGRAAGVVLDPRTGEVLALARPGSIQHPDRTGRGSAPVGQPWQTAPAVCIHRFDVQDRHRSGCARCGNHHRHDVR